MNNFFCSVFTDENTESMPVLGEKCGIELSGITVTEKIIEKQLRKLKVNKSQGPDSLHPRVLKEIAPCIIRPLMIIYTKFIKSGVLPSQWKQGQVTPLFKKGDKNEPGNYRPVSLTSVLCKVLEGIIREQVMNHMVTNSYSATSNMGLSLENLA